METAVAIECGGLRFLTVEHRDVDVISVFRQCKEGSTTGGNDQELAKCSIDV